MEKEVSSIRTALRNEINSSKDKREQKSINNTYPGQNQETLFVNEDKLGFDIKSKIKSINAPEPREGNLFSEKRALTPYKSEKCEKSRILNDDHDSRFSARILKSTKDYISNFKSIIPSKMRKNAGGGSCLEAIVEELRFYRSEEQEHIREIVDFLRQTQNAEKNYKLLFGRFTEEELEAKQKFSKSISTLAFVLDLKKFSDQRLVQLMNANLLPKEIYWEIHYYLHSEIYTKWKGRGLA